MKARLFRSMRVVVAVAGVCSASHTLAQDTTPPKMPHTAVENPEFIQASRASFLSDDDVLLGISHGVVSRAYPAADVAQHGAVFDQMPDGPIAVTWCSICGTGVVFRAEAQGRPLHLDPLGLEGLVGANEVFKDRETGSRWQQATGTAISGPLEGTKLELYPFIRTTWGEWKTRHPNTVVLKPLPGYAERMPIFNRVIRETRFGAGPAPEGAFGRDDRLPPRETVAGLELGDAATAYSFSMLRKTRVVNVQVGATAVLIVHQPKADTTTAFASQLNGRALRFQAVDQEASRLVDLETKSLWNAYGLCLEGPLKGSQLEPVIVVPEFWFAWSEFHPDTNVYDPGVTN